MKREVTQSNVLDLLRYEEGSGRLFWKLRPVEYFLTDRAAKAWNARWGGAEAFTAVGNNGYKYGAIFNQSMLAHRVIWLLMHGCWPENDIDHVNGNRSDNRAANLRAATRAENMQNVGGVRGVRRNHIGRYVAEIQVNGNRFYLGSFAAEEEASIAYQDAKAKYHSFNPVRRCAPH